jgi:hypothetical protein
LVKGKTRPLTVLRRAGIEPHLSGLHVHLPPFQGEDLARRPQAGDVRELIDSSHVGGQLLRDAPELLRLEEALPHVVLLQERDVRPHHQLPRLGGERTQRSVLAYLRWMRGTRVISLEQYRRALDELDDESVDTE